MAYRPKSGVIAIHPFFYINELQIALRICYEMYQCFPCTVFKFVAILHHENTGRNNRNIASSKV
jgi:hypothetical protein